MSSDWVLTSIPSSAVVVQEAGKPRRPSISTRHIRQDPNDLRESVAHSLGIFIPLSDAARITDEPSGTVTLTPSIDNVIIVSLSLSGVPKSACGS